MKPAGKVNRLLARCQLALWLILLPVTATASQPSEYELKLAYLYNFTKFVNWPDTAFSSPEAPFNICLIGKTEGADFISLLAGKQSFNRPLALYRINEPSANTLCHILFISRSLPLEKTQRISQSLSTPTLIVGEVPNFAEKFGAIGFIMDDQRRIRIQINLNDVQKRKLSVRAQLIEVAQAVYRDEEQP